MKISQNTIALLKNMSTINQSIVISPGSLISTAAGSSIVAVAEVEEDFPQEFGIYDLPQFLNILSIFTEPTIEFKTGKQVTISQDRMKVSYLFAEPSILTKAPKGVKELPSVAKFELTQTVLAAILKAKDIISLPQLVIKGEDGVLSLVATNTALNEPNTYSVEIGETDRDFKAFVSFDNLKVIPGTYNVDLSERFLKMSAVDKNLNYWVALDVKGNKF